MVFTITNPGTGNLTGLTITTDGFNAGDFTVTTIPMATVIIGGSTTFTLQFSPVTTGAKTAAIHIANNVSGKNPYTINLVGQFLYNQSQYDANRAAGQTDVTGSPGSYSLYTLAQYNGSEAQRRISRTTPRDLCGIAFGCLTALRCAQNDTQKVRSLA